MGVAERDQLVRRERDGRKRPDQTPGDRHNRIQERSGLPGQERGDQLGIGGRLQRLRVVGDLLAQGIGVGQVPIVAERDQPVAAVARHRLGVLPLVRAGRRIAHVPDRRMARQAAQRGLVEHRADQAEVPLHHDVSVIGDRNSCALLASVLERVEGEERQPGDVTARRDDPDDAAFVVRRVVVPHVAHATALVRVAS